MTLQKIFSRRQILVSSGVLAAATFLPHFGRATLGAEKSLTLYNIHTGEWFKGVFAIHGTLLPERLGEISHFLRDFRTGDVKTIDPRLLHLLHQVADLTGERKGFEVISGYRSPATNTLLQKMGRNVATDSYHMKGQAIDIRGSRGLKFLQQAAKSQEMGGVGYYPKSRFVHMDTRGEKVYW